MIRRLITLGAVGILVWLLLQLTSATESAHPAERTFMLGFALLSAALLGEMAEQVRLPQITGYIIAGILFGPWVARLLTPKVVESLGLVNDMAYAFIGLAAGAELRFTVLRRRWKSIVLLIVLTTVVVAAGTAGALYLWASYRGLLGGMSALQLLAVSAMVGVIAAARSPSSAIAIIDETRAEGPFSETVLGVTLAIDVVVICLFSVSFALCSLAFAPGQGFDLLFMLTLGGEIAVSVVVGALLGAGIGTYLKREGPYVPLVIVGLCFLVYRCSEVLGHYLVQVHDLQIHLEPLLICATAGFTIQNLSHQGARLSLAMDRVALPVYVVFFTMTGARLDLGALLVTWGTALLVAGVRLLTMMAGAGLATVLAGDPPHFRRYCWLGFVTQAGLSLALIAQLESAFAGWGAQLATILVAVVAINQLLGPAVFKIALERAGEVRGRLGAARRTV